MPQSPSACRYTRTAPSTRRHVESAPRRCRFQETRKTTAAPRQAGEKPLPSHVSFERRGCLPLPNGDASGLGCESALATIPPTKIACRVRCRAHGLGNCNRAGFWNRNGQAFGWAFWQVAAASLVCRGSFSYRVLCLSVRMGTDTTCRLNRWMEIDGKRRWLSRLMFFFWDRQEKL